ncbi:MAG TPA: alpha/beta hydrolase [Candidatus Corynebacterium avicola]|uniref:Alpha/beta hydrolase n=1 Tax=Candidatus Corynebacterium avicola TaxID=2838527 RepID=A0A9D1RTE7_9CORY|nr:alpha/beta hydrolase [Candidatus Corynebacterium avicola]
MAKATHPHHPSASRATNPGNGVYSPNFFDKATAFGGRLLSRIPVPVLRALGTVRNKDGDLLDADVRASLLALKLISSLDIVDVPPVHSRKIVEKEAFIAAGDVRVAHVHDTAIAGVGVRVYHHAEPEEDLGPRPVLIYVHGGGWVTGSLDSHDATCRSLCADGRVTVVSVDYRMAPEHPFPTPLDDVYEVVTAVQDATPGGEVERVVGAPVDTSRLIIAGDSAGGNLAAATCLKLRAEGRDQPVLQLLFVPVTDLANKSASRLEFGDLGLYLTEEQISWYEHHYLGRGDTLGTSIDPTHPLVSPLLAEDLTGLAPAYIAVAGFDPLRDEGEAYAARLKEAGVPVNVVRHRGLVHPFINSVAVWRGSRKAMEQAVSAVSSAISQVPSVQD